MLTRYSANSALILSIILSGQLAYGQPSSRVEIKHFAFECKSKVNSDRWIISIAQDRKSGYLVYGYQRSTQWVFRLSLAKQTPYEYYFNMSKDMSTDNFMDLKYVEMIMDRENLSIELVGMGLLGTSQGYCSESNIKVNDILNEIRQKIKIQNEERRRSNEEQERKAKF